VSALAAPPSRYRGTLARGKTGANVKVGIALHWNKVCGNCFEMPQGLSTTQYNASYAKVRRGRPTCGRS
jgi:hypothetical protein